MKPIDQIEVLVVEDQKSMRELAMVYLFKLGFRRIFEADSGEKAVALAQEKVFDLLLVDWNLGGMTGLDVVKTLRMRQDYSSSSFLMATGENKMSNLSQAVAAGANNYIVKPFTDVELKSRIERCLMRAI